MSNLLDYNGGPVVDQRRGNWMQTYGGKKAWPCDLRDVDIEIVDIAHSLSMQCRYGGHCLRFYSVAEHCVFLSYEASWNNRLWALMHDAGEAYVGDMPRPLKASMPQFKLIEEQAHKAIAHRFGLPYAIPAEVHLLDNRILLDEQAQNMKPGLLWGMPDDLKPLGVKLEFWTPAEAKSKFLQRFYELEGDRDG